ncbi:hypothetical protein MIR68_012600 [Amoeboaphelidium protococcarum]|nr:hypothetical protein MIR68_012600 [Amoeboaphelidium protococcarum]
MDRQYSDGRVDLKSLMNKVPQNDGFIMMDADHQLTIAEHRSKQSRACQGDANWSESKYKTVILYLEPPSESPLHQSIRKYFDSISHDKSLLNEAHCYHAHTSMTGFFDLPMMSNDALADNHIQHLIQLIDTFMQKYLIATVDRPFVSHLQCQSNPQQQVSCSVKLQTPQSYKDMVEELQTVWASYVQPHLHSNTDSIEQLKRFQIRQKPIDHISLAYTRDVSLMVNGYRMDPDKIKRLYRQAKQTIDLRVNNDERVDPTQMWSVALYELKEKSTTVLRKHQFQCIKRWYI